MKSIIFIFQSLIRYISPLEGCLFIPSNICEISCYSSSICRPGMPRSIFNYEQIVQIMLTVSEHIEYVKNYIEMC